MTQATDEFSSTLRQAKQYHQTGRLHEAESCYRKLLNLAPENIEALNLYGVLKVQLNNRQVARQLLEQAIELDDSNPDTHVNLANVMIETGDIRQAEQYYRRAIELEPAHAEAWFNMGNLFVKMEHMEQAIDCFKHAIEADPGHVNSLNNLGQCLVKTGKDAEAVKYFEQLLNVEPANLNTWISLVQAVQRLGNFELAMMLADQIQQYTPEDARTFFRLSEMYWSLGRLEETAQQLRQAILLEPGYTDAIANLGGVLGEMREYALAEKILHQAIEQQADHANAWCNLASAVQHQGRETEAREYLNKTLGIEPQHPTAYDNLGYIEWEAANYAEAEQAFRQAIRYNPEHINAHTNLGMVLLTQGGFEQGWREYSWRTRLTRNLASERSYTQPVWQGEDLQAQSLFVYPEQGLGDIIQFIRYAYLLSSGVKQLIIEVPKCLKRLLSGFQEHALLVSPGETVPAFDRHIPLLSLPAVFRTDEDSIPGFTPYIHPEAERIEVWSERLSQFTGTRIGLAWQGNSNNMMDHKRSIPLEQMRPLLDLQNVQYVSLQKGEGEEQLIPFADYYNLTVFGDELDAGPDAFLDTIAIIANLDLVITCDSAIAHLAGAMGKPVWILLAHVADFRWLLKRTDSPWYPSVRLFRQDERGNWQHVIEKVRNALMEQYQTIKPMG